MARAPRNQETATGWTPRSDPPGRYSTGIPDLDRLMGGGFQRGSLALVTTDESVGTEDLDLLLFPTYLNFLYQSRGVIGILPSRDSPHAFRGRMTRFVTRRRFDSRVRLVDYVGEDEGAPYVVNVRSSRPEAGSRPPPPKERTAAISKMVEAERVVRGNRQKPFLELTAFEVFETLMGAEPAMRLFYHGAKRSRELGNLAVGILGPGLGSAAGVRRMADTELALHRDEVGLTVKGIRPSFPNHVVTTDRSLGPPHVAFVPRPD
jgi:hypothetical protein